MVEQKILDKIQKALDHGKSDQGEEMAIALENAIFLYDESAISDNEEFILNLELEDAS